MRLTFLGTGTSQGVPVIACGCGVCRSEDGRDKRLRTSALLTVNESTNILFDIGPDFRQQMLRERVKRLDAILVTHAHRDHVAGLDDVRSFNYVQHKKMDVYLNREAKVALERDYKYIFEHHEFPGLPEADLHEVEGTEKSFRVAEGVEVVPVRAMHKDLPILGYRIGPLAYITDMKTIHEEEIPYIEGCDTLVVNALREKPHHSHQTLSEAVSFARRIGARQTWLIHSSHDIGRHAEVNASLPGHIQLAYDGQVVSI